MTQEKEAEQTLSLIELFITFLKINAFTFGGGYTIVPVIRDEFVKKKQMISEEEMLDLVALAQSGPGPMAINASLLTGYRVKGPVGALVSLLASVLPCLLVITLFYYVYDAISENLLVRSAFQVMGGAISAVLVITTYNMAKSALKNYRIFGIVLMLGAFCGSYFFIGILPGLSSYAD